MRPCRRDDRRRRYGSPTGPIARGSVARVGAATALAVACVYTVIYLAALTYPRLVFDIRGVLGALGIATGATHGLLQETTREVRWARSTQIVAGHRTHPLRVAGMIGTVAAVVIAGSSPLWSRQLFVEGAGCPWGYSALGWPGSARRRPCWARWPASTGGHSTGH